MARNDEGSTPEPLVAAVSLEKNDPVRLHLRSLRGNFNKSILKKRRIRTDSSSEPDTIDVPSLEAD